jgi:O-antigen/teichoic acid export membrane protein
MLSGFKKLLFTETGKDTTIVFIGTLINVVSGGLFFILVPRLLGPSDFGIFSTVVATGLVATTIANFGIDTGILKFAKNDSQTNAVFSLALRSYIVLGAAIAVLGYFLSRPIAHFLGQPQIAIFLQIAFLSTIFLLLTNFYVAALQVKREFAKASLVNISSNVTRIILLMASAYFFLAGLYFVTLLFFMVTIISVLIGYLLLKFEYQKEADLKIGTFYKYNVWIALSLILSSIPFDNYLLLKISGPVQTGLYAAPFKILTFAYQFGGNFSRVLASRFSSFDTDEKAKAFSSKTAGFICLFVLAFLVLIMIAHPVVRLLLGSNYIQAVPIMQILSVGFIFFFASIIPSSVILYYFGKSSVSFVITAIRYVAFVILLLTLVPKQNAIGAAYAFTLSEGFAFALMALYVLIKFQRKYAN